MDATEGADGAQEPDDQAPRDAATLVHDLRTPLTIIKGFADMLASGAITKANIELPEIGERILHAAERLEELIKEVLPPSDRDEG